MQRIAISLVLGSILLGCSKYPAEKPLEERDGHEASVPPQANTTAPPAPVMPPVEAKGTIVGKVVDGRGDGVEDVEIRLDCSDYDTESIATTTTEADGRFTIEDVPIGDGFVIKAVKKKSLFGVHGEKQDILVQANKIVDVGNIELKISVSSNVQK